ncbi:MAG: reverse transcriptase (RNA-dependent DNA polymerase)-domain-containing protein, partial [Olpidium bornovanus]
ADVRENSADAGVRSIGLQGEAELTDKAEEALNVSNGGQDEPLRDCLSFSRVRSKALSGNEMSEIRHFVATEGALFRFHAQAGGFEAIEDLAQIDEVLIEGRQIDDHVIEVHQATLQPETPDSHLLSLNSSSVWRLNKALYGLLQLAHEWNAELDKELKNMGFVPVLHEPCLYVHRGANRPNALMAVYVDDIILAGPDITELAVSLFEGSVEGSWSALALESARYVLHTVVAGIPRSKGPSDPAILQPLEGGTGGAGEASTSKQDVRFGMEEVYLLAAQMRAAEVPAAVVQFTKENGLFKEEDVSAYLRLFETTVRQWELTDAELMRCFKLTVHENSSVKVAKATALADTWNDTK